MEYIIAFLSAIIPGLIWLRHFYRIDKYEREPLSLVFLTMMLGAFSVVPALILEILFENFGILNTADPSNWLMLFISTFIVIGPIEELSKLLPVRLTVYRSKEFNEPMDGIVYASASALGFATVENMVYFLSADDFTISFVILRSFLSMLGHVMFSSMWGFALGIYKFDRTRKFLLINGIVMASFLHGLFNFFLFTGTELAVLSIALIVFIYFVMFRKRVRYLLKVSPFNPDNKPEQVCSYCGYENESSNIYCEFCDSPLELFWINNSDNNES